MYLRWIASLPSIALAIVWCHHIVDLVVVERKELTLDNLKHPWFVFAAAVSLSLFLIHVLMLLLFTCKCYRFVAKTRLVRWFRQYVATVRYGHVELFLAMVDVTWSVLWLMQLMIQAMLTDRHRLYKLHIVRFLAILYVIQIIFTIPLCVHLHRRNINTKQNLSTNVRVNVRVQGKPLLVGTGRRVPIFGGPVRGSGHG